MYLLQGIQDKQRDRSYYSSAAFLARSKFLRRAAPSTLMFRELNLGIKKSGGDHVAVVIYAVGDGYTVLGPL